jgi:hypothetical protein
MRFRPVDRFLWSAEFTGVSVAAGSSIITLVRRNDA